MRIILVLIFVLVMSVGCNNFESASISLEVSSQFITRESIFTLSAKTTGSELVKVVFYDGDTKLGEDTSTPYSFDLQLTADQNGNHIYKVVAVDSLGNTLAIAEQKIIVDIASPPQPQPTHEVTFVVQGDIHGAFEDPILGGSPYNPCGRAEACIGDDQNNKKVWGYIEFALQLIGTNINTENLISAKIRLFGGNNPAIASKLGDCKQTNPCIPFLVDHIDGRNMFPGIDPSAFFDSNQKLSSVDIIGFQPFVNYGQNTQALTIDVRDALLEDLANADKRQGVTSYRIRPKVNTNGDNFADYFYFANMYEDKPNLELVVKQR